VRLGWWGALGLAHVWTGATLQERCRGTGVHLSSHPYEDYQVVHHWHGVAVNNWALWVVFLFACLALKPYCADRTTSRGCWRIQSSPILLPSAAHFPQNALAYCTCIMLAAGMQPSPSNKTVAAALNRAVHFVCPQAYLHSVPLPTHPPCAGGTAKQYRGCRVVENEST
jgi:hypothetical protein